LRLAIKRIIFIFIHSYLDDPSEVFPVDIIVGLEEHLPKATLAHWVVFSVEFVKAVESVSIL
jgi:hypothetical protein